MTEGEGLGHRQWADILFTELSEPAGVETPGGDEAIAARLT